MIISHARAKEIIQEEILKSQLINEQRTNWTECAMTDNNFPWISDTGKTGSDIDNMSRMIKTIENSYPGGKEALETEAPEGIHVPYLLQIWDEWTTNVYGRTRQSMIRGKQVPDLVDLLPEADIIFCKWAQVATELGYSDDLNSWIRFVESGGEPSRGADNSLYDKFTIAKLSLASRRIPAVPGETRPGYEDDSVSDEEIQEAKDAACTEIKSGLAPLINSAYSSGPNRWVPKLADYLSGYTTDAELKKCVNIIYESLADDTSDMIRTRMLIGMYAIERRGMFEQIIDIAALIGGASLGNILGRKFINKYVMKWMPTRFSATTFAGEAARLRQFSDLSKWGMGVEIIATAGAGGAAFYGSEAVEAMGEYVWNWFKGCLGSDEAVKFMAMLAPEDDLQMDGYDRYSQFPSLSVEMENYVEVIAGENGVVAGIQRGDLENKHDALAKMQNILGGHAWATVTSAPPEFGSERQVAGVPARLRTTVATGWDIMSGKHDAGIIADKEAEAAEEEAETQQESARSSLRKSISAIISESHNRHLILELRPEVIRQNELAAEAAEEAARVAREEALDAGGTEEEADAAATAAERDVVRTHVSRQPTRRTGTAAEADEEEESEEEAQEPTERANFVERRGSPTRGTVYIHYRNWPTHFYYYFKDGEIGVIRNKPRPPEGAVRGWHLAELGDMDLFPSGTSGWTTLYGEMRDLIRARKLVEVDRFNDTPADLGLVIPAAIPEYPDSQMRDFLKDQGRSDSQVESIMTSDRLRQALVLKMKSLGMTPAVGGRMGDIEAALPSEDASETSGPIGRSRTSFNRKRHTWKIPEEHRQAFDFGSGYGNALVKKIILRDSEPFEVTPELAFTGTRGPFIDVVIDVAPDNPLAGRRSLRRIGSRNQAYDDIIEYIRNNSDNFNA